MRKNRKLLLGLAVGNIRKNLSTYLPYIMISTFVMFTYFVFDLVLHNDMMYTLPKGGYAVMMIGVGYYLLGFIMVPFLYYTNSFLIKRRKRELGLYSILGMEKKHIGVMMFWESLMLYGIIMAAAFALGLLFYRLVFMILLSLSKMPVNVELSISFTTVTESLLFYGFVTVLNLFVNLVQVGKANPIQLMSEAKSGEKQPKLLPLWSLLGALTLGGGYWLALTTKFNIEIFTNFFLAVALVVVGTYFLFTSGSIVFLQFMKRRKRLYYRPDNFITVSGMLYRMKKSAAGLSNICIFSTMAIITAICTLSVCLGMDSIKKHTFEKELEIKFLGRDTVDRDALKNYISTLNEDTQAGVHELVDFAYVDAIGYVDKGQFLNEEMYQEYQYYADIYGVTFTVLEEYNYLEGSSQTLTENQVLIYSTGGPGGWKEIHFGDRTYEVKEELDQCGIWEKSPGNYLDPVYVIIASNEEELNFMAQVLGVSGPDSWVYYCGFDLGGEEDWANAFSNALYEHVVESQDLHFASYRDHRQEIEEEESTYGGLIFVGIFYGLIFLICLVVTMYYKQITEGYEDRKSFEIMQKIGMSDGEIRHTIKTQVRMVFYLPLAGALLHTAVGIRMVYILLGAIRFYEIMLLLGITLGVSLLFAIVYCLCYRRTSMAYYKIVRWM